MGILDSSKRYRVSGAKLNCDPPRVVEVHLKSHVVLGEDQENSLWSSSLNESIMRSEDLNMSGNFNCSISPIASVTIESPLETKKAHKSDDSFPSDISQSELAFRLAFPAALRNMLISSRSRANRSNSLPCELNKDSLKRFSKASGVCLMEKRDSSLDMRPSHRNTMQSRKGSWCTNAPLTSSEASSQRVWPRGRFYSFSEKYTPLPQNKVEIIWNDSFPHINPSQMETSLNYKTSPIIVRKNYKRSHYNNNTSDQLSSVLGTPSPPPSSRKPKLSLFLSNCCM